MRFNLFDAEFISPLNNLCHVIISCSGSKLWQKTGSTHVLKLQYHVCRTWMLLIRCDAVCKPYIDSRQDRLAFRPEISHVAMTGNRMAVEIHMHVTHQTIHCIRMAFRLQFRYSRRYLDDLWLLFQQNLSQ